MSTVSQIKNGTRLIFALSDDRSIVVDVMDESEILGKTGITISENLRLTCDGCGKEQCSGQCDGLDDDDNCDDRSDELRYNAAVDAIESFLTAICVAGLVTDKNIDQFTESIETSLDAFQNHYL